MTIVRPTKTRCGKLELGGANVRHQKICKGSGLCSLGSRTNDILLSLKISTVRDTHR